MSPFSNDTQKIKIDHAFKGNRYFNTGMISQMSIILLKSPWMVLFHFFLFLSQGKSLFILRENILSSVAVQLNKENISAKMQQM